MQYQVKLPLVAYVIQIYSAKKPFGYYPLTDNVPMLFPNRKAAMRHKLGHEKIVKVKISPCH